MKTDRLENYMIQNRAAFDTVEAPEGLFEKIRRPEKKVIRIQWRQVAWRAAAVVIIFTASYFVHDLINRDPQQPVVAEETPDINPLFEEFLEAEVYYSAMIQQKKDKVFSLTKNDPMVYDEINTELVELDKVYDELKNDLGDNADNEQVLEALIQNYRLKLDILEEMLFMLQKADDQENIKDHENTSREI